MGNKIKKNQNPVRVEGRATGVIIDCDEITISVFPPPREHGDPHCHIKSKNKTKYNGKEVNPEIKVFLNIVKIIVITDGFAERDFDVIEEIIFNDAEEGEISNDQYLLDIWEELHND